MCTYRYKYKHTRLLCVYVYLYILHDHHPNVVTSKGRIGAKATLYLYHGTMELVDIMVKRRINITSQRKKTMENLEKWEIEDMIMVQEKNYIETG